MAEPSPHSVSDEITMEKEEEEEKEEDDDEEEVHEREVKVGQVNKLIQRLSQEKVPIRVHDIKIKGNTKTKDSVLECELEEVRNAETLQELVQAATRANARLHRLGIFQSANITLDAGPPDLPDTANVIVVVEEDTSPFTGDIGIFSKPQVLHLYFVNEGVLELAKNPVFTKQTWHVEFHYHYISKLVEDGFIQLYHVPTEDQTVDVLNKSLGLDKFVKFKGQLVVVDRLTMEAQTWTFEGSLKSKNWLGYGETWDGTGSYGWDKTSEMSVGLSYPRFKGLPAALLTRLSLLTEDWVKWSSYKERLFGLSVGLVTDEHHDLTYNLTWRSLMDPSHRASRSIRRQLGHTLLSSIKYTYKIDERDSPVRPTRGFAFASTSQIAGIGPDSRLLRFVRQELDFRYAIPLGFYNAALNVGLSAGIIIPWGKGFKNLPTPVSDRFFMGGHSSPVCSLRGPTSLLGFRSRGVGPTDERRHNSDAPTTDDTSESSGRDSLGGDFAVTGFADLSFDLPLKLFRDAGIHGHCFACAGNLTKLTGDLHRSLSFREFGSSFRYSAGAGIILPTKLFRIEINYCQILRQFDHDRAKQGIQLSFSSPT